MQDRAYKIITFTGVKRRQRTLVERLDDFRIDGFVPDDEFARDMDLLVSGKMAPEDHRAYLKGKYQRAA